MSYQNLYYRFENDKVLPFDLVTKQIFVHNIQSTLRTYSTLYLAYTFQLSLNLRYNKGVVYFSNVVYTEAQKVYTQIMICAWAYPACKFFAQTIISS